MDCLFKINSNITASLLLLNFLQFHFRVHKRFHLWSLSKNISCNLQHFVWNKIHRYKNSLQIHLQFFYQRFHYLILNEQKQTTIISLKNVCHIIFAEWTLNIYLSNFYNYTVLRTQNLEYLLKYKNILINLHLMYWTKNITYYNRCKKISFCTERISECIISEYSPDATIRETT